MPAVNSVRDLQNEACPVEQGVGFEDVAYLNPGRLHEAVLIEADNLRPDAGCCAVPWICVELPEPGRCGDTQRVGADVVAAVDRRRDDLGVS